MRRKCYPGLVSCSSNPLRSRARSPCTRFLSGRNRQPYLLNIPYIAVFILGKPTCCKPWAIANTEVPPPMTSIRNSSESSILLKSGFEYLDTGKFEALAVCCHRHGRLRHTRNPSRPDPKWEVVHSPTGPKLGLPIPSMDPFGANGSSPRGIDTLALVQQEIVDNTSV